MNFKSPHKQQGIALLAVLAVSVALSLLITSATVMMQRQLTIGETAKQQFIEKATAYGKAQEIAYLLGTQRLTPAGVSKGENETGSQRAEGRFLSTLSNDELRVDGFEYSASLADVNIRYSIQAIDGLIAINTPDQFWLKLWLESYNINTFTISKLADHAADYADEDDWSRPAGAEAFNYGKSFLAPLTNFLFQKCSELNNVMLWSEVITENNVNLKHCSLSRSATVNINAMPFELLKQIFPSSAERTIRNRAAGNWIIRESDAVAKISALNTVASDFFTTVSRRSFAITVKTENTVANLHLKRGIGALQPVTFYNK